MAQYEVAWTFPQYSGYSILNAAVNPAICWNDVQNNPFISAFEVDFLNLEDNSWINIGTTTANYIRFPSDIYNSESVYQIRIATIGTDGRRSPYAYSQTTFSSPLVFDFTEPLTVKLINGSDVPNQRYLFLVL
jgi:hypothetical protein